MKIAIDAAASEFYKDGVYDVDGKDMSSEQLTDYYSELIEKYPFVSIEDSHSEDDWDGFKGMYEKMGDKMQLVGDHLGSQVVLFDGESW